MGSQRASGSSIRRRIVSAHPPGARADEPARRRHRRLRRMPDPKAAPSQGVADRPILAERPFGHAADRQETFERQRQRCAGLASMARPRVVNVRVEATLQFTKKRLVAAFQGTAPPQRRRQHSFLGRIETQAADDRIDPGVDDAKNVRDPARRNTRVGIRRHQDAVPQAKRGQAAGGFRHDEPPRPAGICVVRPEFDIVHVEVEWQRRGQRAGGFGRRIIRIVDEEQHLERPARERRPVARRLRAERLKTGRDTLFLVAGRDGDDDRSAVAGRGARHRCFRGRTNAPLPPRWTYPKPVAADRSTGRGSAVRADFRAGTP